MSTAGESIQWELVVFLSCLTRPLIISLVYMFAFVLCDTPELQSVLCFGEAGACSSYTAVVLGAGLLSLHPRDWCL